MKPSWPQKLAAVYRPRTLPIAIAPVLMGNALAYHEQSRLNVWVLLGCLVCALCIQMATNAFNDVEDHQRQVDNTQRLGPKRAASEGWLKPKTIRQLAWLMVGLAVVVGVYLVYVGGVPILGLGLLSLFFGWAYSAGPKPISTSYLSELVSWLFFGLVGVLGSYYLQTLGWSLEAFLAGFGLGALVAAVLLVNNYRDQHTDAQANRRTLALVLGNTASKWVYAGLFMVAYLAVISVRLNYWVLLLLPWAGWLVYSFSRRQPHKEQAHQLNQLLAQTALFVFLFAVFASLGWLIQG